jgi:DNA polymerase III epsilon subunit-like protein
MAAIKTLVYFDLEATGLKSSGRPRISELSFVAIDAQEINIMNKKLSEKVKNITCHEDILLLETLIPRVLNKLTICVYPMATIMPEVSSITGLDNYNLTGQDKFDKSTGDLLNAFLSRLPFPVCLVAHNGNAYDFPLLRAELVKAGAEFGPNIFCVDSYVGIKEIFKMDMGNSMAERVKPKDTENIEEKEIVKNEMEAVKSLLEAGEFDMEMGSSLAECMKPTENIEEKEIVKNEMEAVKSLLEAGGFDMEMDIDRSKSIKFRKLLKKEQSRNINSLEMLIEKSKSEQTPPRNSSEPSRSIKIVKKKQLHNRVLQYKKKLEFPASQSFSLINLHRQLLGYTPTSLHGAEADSLALLRITAMLGEKWLGWANDNCSLISETKCMWGN